MLGANFAVDTVSPFPVVASPRALPAAKRMRAWSMHSASWKPEPTEIAWPGTCTWRARP